MPKLKHLFEPFTVKSLTIRNRIVMPGMLLRYSDQNGMATQRLTDFYVARAKGGVGLIVAEAAYILPEAKFRPNQFGIYSDELIPKIREMLDEIHKYGAKVALQLHHAGRRLAESHLPGTKPVGASKMPCKFSGLYPRVLAKDGIAEIVEGYAAAAERGKRAGFDAVEIHGAHGYIINQFLSPFTNKRTDEYGGTPERRARFAVEIVEAIRARVGDDYPIFMRMNGDDHVPGGITIEEARVHADLLAKAGVDVLNVSAGIIESLHWQIPVMRLPDCCLADLSEDIKKRVNIPIMAVGKIRTAEQAEEVLASGKADLVAMARAFLADPDWPNKAAKGEFDKIRPCISCNMGCIDKNISRFPGVTCTVNPEVGKETLLSIGNAKSGKKVLIAGGGPAGMEAARVAAQRGHKVFLYEKESQLGGQARYAALAAHKEGMQTLLDYQQREAGQYGIEIQLGKAVDLSVVEEIKPDVVIIATGATPILPQIPGINLPNVFQAQEILESPEKAGSKVVVIGGGLVGLETAETLAEQGKDVTVLEMLPQIGADLGYTSNLAIFESLEKLGVKIETGTKVTQISDKAVSATKGESAKEYSADTVILAVGSKPNSTLIDELNGKVKVLPIGDCVQPRKVIEAIHDGYLFARNI